MFRVTVVSRSFTTVPCYNANSAFIDGAWVSSKTSGSIQQALSTKFETLYQTYKNSEAITLELKQGIIDARKRIAEFALLDDLDAMKKTIEGVKAALPDLLKPEADKLLAEFE